MKQKADGNEAAGDGGKCPCGRKQFTMVAQIQLCDRNSKYS